jgi:hypothetical protein
VSHVGDGGISQWAVGEELGTLIRTLVLQIWSDFKDSALLSLGASMDQKKDRSDSGSLDQGIVTSDVFIMIW